ncbi:MAG: hypothetical protein GF400_04035 [Candidatus Eisenbacteria bacterium]|nr:hypothetical protein [Candidatus Eisenbacteria bacterium]
MKRLGTAAAVLLVILGLAASGCYTVLRHPTGPDVAYRGSYVKTCADCHAESEFYHPYYRYGRSHSYWGGYYGSPWWYDDYWWWDYPHGDDGGEPPEIERGERHLWSPGGWPTKGWGVQRSGPDGDAESQSRPSEAARSAPKRQPKKEPKEEPKNDEDKESSEERSLWRSGKKGS